ncbi:hypothetical protein GCM10009821_26350 [Aeromicrobium halocynthiae]|uniref:Uncharacterized protein n=1 Tax=Aeromicrobium halocynthiae TaxID=560557 RepID=A0ABP5HRA0_9ACTN
MVQAQSPGAQPEVWRHSKPWFWTGADAVVVLIGFTGMVVSSVVNFLERHVIPFTDLVGPVHTKREVVFEVAGRRDVTVAAVAYGYWLKDLRGEDTETRGDRFIRAVMEAKAAR